MKIRIIAEGKSKERYWKEAEQEYLKRLSRFAKIEVIEVADERTPENPSDREKEMVLEKEAARILPLLKGYGQIIALAEEGVEYDSLSFAGRLQRLEEAGQGAVFLIGGSFGLAATLKKQATEKISLSKMTFPHRLARITLLEQLFRAYKINNNETYHK
ncbi:MAG: 23S rRNA (pseudouridine(1915)-N(3))-methyltransferase RlmH [Christensenellaceae bacterium]|jgi:23S rRNA (pseudouridine1915-N3)-methyltransferase